MALTPATAAVAAPSRVPSSTPDAAQSLVEVLDWHVAQHPDRPHIQLYEDQGDGDVISYRQLQERAQRVAAGLQQRGLQAGDRLTATAHPAGGTG